ncbi:MAG: hypothetical protein KC964_13165 [Candidatus Omnitrophica bacterium]|nr:hypothetical protein [Candidatus Omnitrophota bacterium]
MRGASTEEGVEILPAFLEWMETLSKGALSDQDKSAFLELFPRLFELALFAGPNLHMDRFHDALNSPMGCLAYVLIRFLWKGDRKAGTGIPLDFRAAFDGITASDDDLAKYGKSIFASHLPSLFSLDPEWTKDNLIPRFSWESPDDALMMWSGYLYSKHINLELLIQLKMSLIEAVTRSDEWHSQFGDLVDLFVVSCLELGDCWQDEEIRKVMQSMPTDGLVAAAKTISQLLKGSEDKMGEYWINRVKPFFTFWPKDREKKTVEVGEKIAEVILSTGDQFPDAMETLHDFVSCGEHPHWLLLLLKDTAYPEDHPKVTLQFLDRGMPEAKYPEQEFAEILKRIVNKHPSMADTEEYKRLDVIRLRMGL